MSWIVALPLLAVCLTGIALAFQEELYRLEEPLYFDLDADGRTARSLPEVLEIYKTAQPPLHLNYLQVPQSPHAPYLAFARELPEDGEERGLRALVNPYTGELFRLYQDKTWIRQIEVWHRTLALGQWGRWTVGASSLVLAVTSGIGLVLWWPMRRRTFRRAIKRGNALDWHNALGFISMLPLCVLAFTGVTFTWGKQVFPLLDQLQGKPSRFEVPEVPPTLIELENESLYPLSLVAEELMRTHPEAIVTGVQDSRKETRPYIFNFSRPGDVHPGGTLKLYVNPQDGQVFEQFEQSEAGWVGLYRRFFYILHTGHPFPWWGRLFWAAASMIGMILVLTGCWMSVKRWRS